MASSPNNAAPPVLWRARRKIGKFPPQKTLLTYFQLSNQHCFGSLILDQIYVLTLKSKAVRVQCHLCMFKCSLSCLPNNRGMGLKSFFVFAPSNINETRQDFKWRQIENLKSKDGL